jgi:hypothetical protein
MTDNKINVTIGEHSELFHVRCTSAPKDYDGFGTITLADYGSDLGRVVMIRDEHLQWQSLRYNSGNHACQIPPPGGVDGVEEELWKRLARQ